MSSALPRLRRRVGTAYRRTLEAFPDALTVWFRPPGRRFSLSDVPAAVTPPEAAVRLFIAPANFAAQGHALARAAERVSDVGAVSMQSRSSQDYGFPADYEVPASVLASSGTWARRQRTAVRDGFTHVIFEAARPIFGTVFDGDVEREIRWLRDRGVAVALLSHGTDLRLPSLHADSEDWSPFRADDVDREWVRRLETAARRNRELGESLGTPLYVVTPELLRDWPTATWLPNIVDPGRWATAAKLLERDRPLILHAPTNPVVKGTALVEPIMLRMQEQGLIDYQRVEQVPSAEMPRLYAGADIVLDQFALGIYSTTSIEAMAAGRLVVAHLSEQVRDHIRAVTGLEPPIVEATPDTLEAVVRGVLADPERYRHLASRGPEYVAAVHDGTLSAEVIRPFLESGAQERGNG